MYVASAISKGNLVILIALLLGIFLCAPFVNAQPKGDGKKNTGQGHHVRTKVVTIITRDDTGNRLKFPSQVFFDNTMEETYVVCGGDKGIIVYNSRYFPIAVLGRGRGVNSPNGLYVDNRGTVYVCQAPTSKEPGRISIYNAAFFKVKDIYFDGIEGAEDFIPNAIALTKDGRMYVAGSARGVLVLNPDGSFSHWLRPKDRLIRPKARGEEESQPESEVGTPGEERASGQPQMMKFLPKELLPTKDLDDTKGEEDEFYVGPVQVTDVEIDSEGHIFVLSEETSKIYIYNAAEVFLYSIGEKGGASGKMSRPQAIAIDEKRKCIYVTDYMRHTILIYDISGRFMFEFGGYGAGPGWFQYPEGIALDRKGNVIIGDFFNQRVQVISLNFKTSFPLFRAQHGKK